MLKYDFHFQQITFYSSSKDLDSILGNNFQQMFKQIGSRPGSHTSLYHFGTKFDPMFFLHCSLPIQKSPSWLGKSQKKRRKSCWKIFSPNTLGTIIFFRVRHYYLVLRINFNNVKYGLKNTFKYSSVNEHDCDLRWACM